MYPTSEIKLVLQQDPILAIRAMRLHHDGTYSDRKKIGNKRTKYETRDSYMHPIPFSSTVRENAIRTVMRFSGIASMQRQLHPRRTKGNRKFVGIREIRSSEQRSRVHANEFVPNCEFLPLDLQNVNKNRFIDNGLICSRFVHVHTFGSQF